MLMSSEVPQSLETRNKKRNPGQSWHKYLVSKESSIDIYTSE